MDKLKIGLRSLRADISRFSQEDIHTLAKEKVETGFVQLDDVLGGGIGPGLTVLGAISGLGKSTLLLQIAEHISSQRTPVLFFSLEMSSEMIAAKALSRQLFIDGNYKKENGISANELISPKHTAAFDSKKWARIDVSRQRAEEKNDCLFIETGRPQKGDGMMDISAEVIYNCVSDYIEETNKKPVVIVDYLQILAPDIKGNDKQSVDNSVKWMRWLAEKHEIPVVLISSLNRASYTQKVQLNSFKETGGIEYSADVVIGMTLCEAPQSTGKSSGESPRHIELAVLKQRYGISGGDSIVNMEYFAKFDYFRERDSKRSKKDSDKTLTKGNVETDDFDSLSPIEI